MMFLQKCVFSAATCEVATSERGKGVNYGYCSKRLAVVENAEPENVLVEDSISILTGLVAKGN